MPHDVSNTLVNFVTLPPSVPMHSELLVEGRMDLTPATVWNLQFWLVFAAPQAAMVRGVLFANVLGTLRHCPVKAL